MALIEVARFHCEHLDFGFRDPHDPCGCPTPGCDATRLEMVAECPACGDLHAELAYMDGRDSRLVRLEGDIG